MNKKAAIIIVNWNGQKYLKDCLESIYKQTYTNFDVYFVDNGSKDNSVSFVEQNFFKTKIIRLDKNTGFALGNNIGIKEALKDSEVKYVVCLNNDTVVYVNWLEELINTVEKDYNIGAVSSKAYFDDKKTIQNAGLEFYKALQVNKKGGISIGFGLTDIEAPELSVDKEIFAPGGVAPLYKREVLEKILERDGEIFDEVFFAYVEDLDLGFRIRSLGYICYLSANAKLIHLHSKTGGVASPLKSYYCERNSILTAVKNFSFFDLLLFPFRNFILKLSYLSNKNESVEKLKGNIGIFRMLWILIKANFVALILVPKFLIKREGIKVEKIYKFLISLFVTFFTLYFLFKGIHIREIEETFSFDWIILFITIFMFGLIKIVNTLRFSKVYGISFSKKLFSDLCISNMFLSIFPFRLGEFSYLKSLNLHTKKGYPDVGAKLIKIRLFDYLSISTLLLISSIFVYNRFSNIVNFISSFFVVSLFFGFLISILFLKLNLVNKIKFSKIRQILIAIENEINSFSLKNSFFLLNLSLISIIYWFLRLLMGYFVLNLLGIEISFFTASFISLSVFVLSLVPLHFIAGFGITEAGFLFFLVQLGFPYEETLIKLLTYHFYIIIPMVIYGLVFLTISKIKLN